MFSEKHLDETLKKFRTPLYGVQEFVPSDSRLLYGERPDDVSAYQEYLTRLYSGVFGDREINSHHTVAEWLECAELEMVRNAAEWGNKDDPDRPVSVRRTFYPLDLLIVVYDQGEGFDYRKIMSKNSRILLHNANRGVDVFDSQLYTSRRPAVYYSHWLSRGILRAREFFSGRQIKPEGGEGFKRLIVDEHGNFGFNDKGNVVYYHLPGQDIIPEDLEGIKGMSFDGFLKRK